MSIPGLPLGAPNTGQGAPTVSVTVTPPVTAANAYGTNYLVGGLLSFAGLFVPPKGGIIQSVTMTCKKVETSGFTLYLFNSNPSFTTWTEAAVAAINASDVPKVIAAIALTASSGLGTHTVLTAYGLGLAVSPGSQTIYGALLSNAALTNNFGTTADVSITVAALQDL